MAVPKHERLIERMMDAYWSLGNNSKSLSDPDRMRDVVTCICAELRKAPRSEDDMGVLSWTADWLELRLDADDALV